MRLAVVNLTSGGLSGGYKKYLSNVMPLMRSDPRVEVLSILGPLELNKLGPDIGPVEVWPSRGRNRWLRARIASASPDCIFIPTSRWISMGGVPTVVSVRNMAPLEYPYENTPLFDKARNLARLFLTRRACENADRIIAVSRHVHDHITDRWAVPSDKVATVHHGVSSPPAPEEPRTLRNRTVGSFLFTAGSLHPPRGLEDLVLAFSEVQADLPDLKIVIAGSRDAGGRNPYRAQLKRMASRSGIAERIVWVDQLDEAEMTWCFRNSIAFVMTSRADSCPNVVLESLAAGAVSISTDKQPMPELYGNGALYYRARQPTSLAARLREAARLDDEERRRLRAAAESRSAEFTWARESGRTITELEAAARS